MHTAIPGIIAFLTDAGIVVEKAETVADGTFVPGIEIDAGRLLVTDECLPSDLLHEAGHLACVPPRFRHLMSGDLSSGQAAMCREVEGLGIDPDGPLMRAVVQCSDSEATAWAWAAGMHLGLDGETIIPNKDYGGTGKEMRYALNLSCYAGINGLVFAGMCLPPRRGGYPAMLKWAQDATEPAVQLRDAEAACTVIET